MKAPHDVLLDKLRRHSPLSGDDLDALRSLAIRTRPLSPGQDLIRQNDRPTVSAVVLSGIVARYHTLQMGRRQYLSLHIPGDWPDAQTLFLDVIDHGVCAIGNAEVGVIQHEHLISLFARRPTVGFAIWRETLIDAAMFREAITNNSGRATLPRMAHFFCELYFRARAADLLRDSVFTLPMTQDQIGETLGMALVTVNRAIRSLRKTGAVDFRDGELRVMNVDLLIRIAEFDGTYLHLDEPASRG